MWQKYWQGYGGGWCPPHTLSIFYQFLTNSVSSWLPAVVMAEILPRVWWSMVPSAYNKNKILQFLCQFSHVFIFQLLIWSLLPVTSYLLLIVGSWLINYSCYWCEPAKLYYKDEKRQRSRYMEGERTWAPIKSEFNSYILSLDLCVLIEL